MAGKTKKKKTCVQLYSKKKMISYFSFHAGNDVFVNALSLSTQQNSFDILRSELLSVHFVLTDTEYYMPHK